MTQQAWGSSLPAPCSPRAPARAALALLTLRSPGLRARPARPGRHARPRWTLPLGLLAAAQACSRRTSSTSSSVTSLRLRMDLHANSFPEPTSSPALETRFTCGTLDRGLGASPDELELGLVEAAAAAEAAAAGLASCFAGLGAGTDWEVAILTGSGALLCTATCTSDAGSVPRSRLRPAQPPRAAAGPRGAAAARSGDEVETEYAAPRSPPPLLLPADAQPPYRRGGSSIRRPARGRGHPTGRLEPREEVRHDGGLAGRRKGRRRSGSCGWTAMVGTAIARRATVGAHLAPRARLPSRREATQFYIASLLERKLPLEYACCVGGDA